MEYHLFKYENDLITEATVVGSGERVDWAAKYLR